MAKLPRSPDRERLGTLTPPAIELPAGTRIWRIYFRAGPHPTEWSTYRYVGPIQGSRFDHHEADHAGQPRLQDRGILYGAMDLATCLAEVFQRHRVINRRRCQPWLAAFDLLAPISLLDLTGTFATQAGASMALMTGPRSAAQRWARAFYETYPELGGLHYPSSMHANRPAVALNERTDNDSIIPRLPQFNRALSDPALNTVLRNTARDLGYGLI